MEKLKQLHVEKLKSTDKWINECKEQNINPHNNITRIMLESADMLRRINLFAKHQPLCQKKQLKPVKILDQEQFQSQSF